MVDEKKLLSILGLAQKAGMIVSGDVAVQKAINSGKAKIILLAADASINSIKSITAMAKKNNIEFYEVLEKDKLGLSIGKAARTSIAIVDRNFTDMIKRCLHKK